jgi:hypothetical protein
LGELFNIGGVRRPESWRLLGYPEVSVYYGSWVEWGKDSHTPIAAEPTS